MNTTNDIIFEALGTDHLCSLPSLMSVDQVAAIFRISHSTVYRLILSKQLPAFKVEGSNEWNIRKQDLIRWLQRNETINR